MTYVVFGAGLLQSAGFAACAPKLPWCQKFPDRTDPNSAIFVGVVKHVTTPAATISPAVARMEPGALHSARRRIGDPKQHVEKQYPMVRFGVLERFVGASSSEFEVHLTSDVFVGAIPQQTPALSEGETWLVDAYYDHHEQKWMTSFCRRTGLARQAVPDLQILRAWASGQRLPARITGQVVSPAKAEDASGVRVELRAAKQTVAATTGRSGQFSFDNLEPGIYVVSTDGGGSRSMDLTRTWCSHVVLRVP